MRTERSCLVMVVSLLTGVLWGASVARAATYGEQMNPTGDPIGGGPGYRDIIRPADADVVVSSARELLDALAAASAGQVVYVSDDARIDLTGVSQIIIPGRVTLAGGRGRGGSLGALIYSGSRHPDQDYMSVFLTGGEGVRLTGLRLRGPSGDYGDHHYGRVGVACCIRDVHGSLEVDNCELWSWDKWAVYLDTIGSARVHHNYIHHTRRAGYGYGVWVADAGRALIEANLFDFNRHHIGSGAQAKGSYEARYNLCLYHDTNPSFDRHGHPDRAGDWTIIHHNTFRNTQVRAILLRGAPLGGARFHHNWFYHADRGAAIDDARANGTRLEVNDNLYGPVAEDVLPAPVIKASRLSGPAPLTVEFDASESHDREGGSIRSYEWNFGDSPGPVGVRSHEAKATHAFREPGRYLVALRVGNEFGITDTAWVPVVARPPEPGYYLSAWVKDSNDSAVGGYYRKQILIDGTVIYDDDSEGREEWEHLVLDVGRHVRGKSRVELAFRLRYDREVVDPKSELHEIFYYIDEVHLFGGSVENGDFEGETGWAYSEVPGDSRWRGLSWRGEARSGKSCYTLQMPYSGTAEAGSYCQIVQSVAIGD